MLHRILRGLRDADVRDIAIVTGHEAEQLEESTGRGDRWGLHLRYFRQTSLDGTAKAVALAREFLAGERFFIGWGDIVVDPLNYRRVIDAAAGVEAVLAVNRVDDPFAGGAVYVDDEFRVTKLVEKPPRGGSTTHWNNAGLMVLPDAIWPFIDALQPSPRGEYELPQAIAAAIAAGVTTKAVPIAGPWFDVGTVESLRAARANFGA